MTDTYPGSWKSAQAKCKRILVAAGFPWSTTTGRYSPFGSKQKTTKGIRVTRIGCSDTVSVDTYGFLYEFRTDRDTSRWIEALAIQTLREAGLPIDDRGWIECDRRSY